MRFSVKNLTQIRNANIDIEGITVIAGENGVGKSSVAKMLYCIYDTFGDSESNIIKERSKTVREYLRFTSLINEDIKSEDAIRRKAVNMIYQAYKDGLVDETVINFLNANNYTSISSDKQRQFIKRIIEALEMTNDEILNAILFNNLNSEFGMQVGHVNYPDKKTECSITDGEKKVLFSVSKSNIIIFMKTALEDEIVYIDGDNLFFNSYHDLYSSGVDHSDKLASKMLDSMRKKTSIIDSMITDKKLSEIESVINDICNGDLLFSEESGYTYKDDELKKSIAINNLSSGLKSYILLKTLLKKGIIKENGILVLDEPEIHLHPEWIKKYAQIIVLLQKEFKLKILVSTHSSDFLSFIELFSLKYGINKVCKYYLFERVNGRETYTKVENVTGKIDIIYRKLGEPFVEANKEMEKLNES